MVNSDLSQYSIIRQSVKNPDCLIFYFFANPVNREVMTGTAKEKAIA